MPKTIHNHAERAIFASAFAELLAAIGTLIAVPGFEKYTQRLLSVGDEMWNELKADAGPAE